MPRAVVCDRIGPYREVLRLAEDAPLIGTLPQGSLKIRVACAGVAFPDLLQVEGKYQIKEEAPFVPVMELAGEVVAIGPGIDAKHVFAVGDRVAGWAAHSANGKLQGALAEEALLMVDQRVWKVPDNVSYEVAVALTRNYPVVHKALVNIAELKAGETLLVLGAAGACGLAAVDLAKALGARVVACASTPQKLEACRAAGADITVDYEEGGTEGFAAALKKVGVHGRIDAVFDPVGGRYAEVAFRAMGKEGRFVVFGFAAGGTDPKSAFPSFPINLLLMRGQKILGSMGRGGPEAMTEMIHMVQQGRLKPAIDKVYKLPDFMQAFDSLSARRAVGKVVIQIGPIQKPTAKL